MTLSAHSDFAVGIVVGIVLTVAVAILLSVTAARATDRYGLDHWKLNLDTPLGTWMNVGYWKTPQGDPILRFQDACAALLGEVLATSGLLNGPLGPASAASPLAVLDLGFGCGDQTHQLARRCRSAGWSALRYVGLTLNDAQIRAARRRLVREKAATSEGDNEIVVFKANAARPETWGADIVQAVEALADKGVEERWLLALDCLYHFSPSRAPIFSYACSSLGANIMAFDLLLDDAATFRQRMLLRLVGVVMGCPAGAFLTEAAYRAQLASCGYDEDEGGITVRDVSGEVFPGLVAFLERQDRALGEYGISLGGFKLAQRLFGWFAGGGVVRPVIVVARKGDK